MSTTIKTIKANIVNGINVDDLLALFGGESKPVVSRLIETGKLTLEDVKAAERILHTLAGKDKAP